MRVAFDTDRLRLELYQKKHIEQTLDFYIKNAEALKEYEPRRDKAFYSLGYHRRQFKYDKREMKDLRYMSFVIKKKYETNNIIGFINCENTFGVFRSCRVGYKIDKDERNKGYLQEALKKVIEIIFDELKLHRIEANVMPHNIPSITVLEKLGFVKEGYGRKYLKINDVWQDHIHFTLLNEKGEDTNV